MAFKMNANIAVGTKSETNTTSQEDKKSSAGNRNGAWLSSKGPYEDIIKSSIAFNPGLAKSDPKNMHIESRLGSSRLTLLELEATSTTPQHHVRQKQFSNANDLELYLDQSGRAAGEPRRIHILEGLDPDFVQFLGSRFSIDPSFFMRQERHPRLEVWDRESHRVMDTQSLPSLADSNQFVLRYPEMRYFNNALVYYRNVCAQTGRPILCVGFEGSLDGIGTICRKCSVWTKVHHDGSWDGESNHCHDILDDMKVSSIVQGIMT
jgi:hypothetical protein